jgi:hypothetical protein
VHITADTPAGAIAADRRREDDPEHETAYAVDRLERKEAP